MAMMMIAGGLLLALLLAMFLRPTRDYVAPMEQRPSELAAVPSSAPTMGALASEAVLQCRGAIADATRGGVIQERPAANRIDVDERKWGELPPARRSRLMQALACDAWEATAPPPDEHVVAYGASSGKRLAVLSGVRRR